MISSRRKRSAPKTNPRAGSRGMTQHQDKELLLLIARDRNREAFSELFERYQRQGFSLAYHISGQRELARDALQKAMLRVWLSANKFQEKGNARGWILKIVARETMGLRNSDLRTKQNKTTYARKQNGSASAKPIKRDSNELNAKLHQAIASLPFLERRMLALYYGGGLSQSQIAQIEAMPQRTVSDRLKQTLSALKERLGDAGLPALSNILLEKNISEAVVTGFEAPSGMLNEIWNRTTESASMDLETISNAQSGPTQAGTTSAKLLPIVIITLASVTLAAWAWREQQPQQPSLLTQAEESKPASENPTQIATPFHKVWEFKSGIPNDFETICGKLELSKATEQGKASIYAKSGYMTTIRLKHEFSSRPYKIMVTFHRDKNEKRNPIIGIFWAKNNALTGYRMWHQSVGQKRSAQTYTKAFYLLKDYLVMELLPDKVISTIRQYRSTTPGNHLLLLIAGCRVERVEIQSLLPNEIPKRFHDMTTLINKMVVKRKGVIENDLPFTDLIDKRTIK